MNKATHIQKFEELHERSLYMKNLIAILITIILSILGLAGCDNNAEVKPTYEETVISTYDEVTESAYEQETNSVYVTSEAAEVSSTNATTVATTNTKTESDTKAEAEDKEVTVGNGGPSVDREPEEENVISQGNATQGHTHSYAAATFKATCTKDGYSLYSCHCGASYESDYVDALGHKWGSWETVKEATTESEGKKQRTCDRCGKVESESIDKILGPYDVPAIDNVDLLCERVLYYINSYREYDTFSPAELEHYAFIRAEQVISNYAHDENDMKAAREESGAICGGECVGRVTIGDSYSVDKAALKIVDQFRNSSAHWNILTDSSLGCMSVGISFSWGNQCYTCVAVSG